MHTRLPNPAACFLLSPWPVHAARELGVPDYHELLPPAYAWWLKRRDKIREISTRPVASAAGDEG